jgi:hypothetical protein
LSDSDESVSVFQLYHSGGDADDGRGNAGVEQTVYRTLVPSVSFCCEPKTVLKTKQGLRM